MTRIYSFFVIFSIPLFLLAVPLFNDTPGNADPVEIGVNYSGSLSNINDKDWYVLTVSQPGRLSILDNVLTMVIPLTLYLYSPNNSSW